MELEEVMETIRRVLMAASDTELPAIETIGEVDGSSTNMAIIGIVLKDGREIELQLYDETV